MSKKITHRFLCSKMMLPEHCSKLREYTAKNRWEKDHRRPDLDEQFQQELQQILTEACKTCKLLRVVLLEESGYRTITGVPRQTVPGSGIIYFDTGRSKMMPVSTEVIIKLDFVHD